MGVKKKNKTVFVGMSGGVDSSVSAALLKDQGVDVVGGFIKVWHPEFLPCEWEKERTDAMRVCARLEIPFMTLDLETEYKREVADYLVEEYRKGYTPNPDVMCNKHIKFGGFFDWAMKQGADYVATGHYAQNQLSTLNFQLLTSKDTVKDQTYFLWTLTQEQLRHTLFPVGGYTKKEVRALARKFNLPTAGKKDSQGICFLGDVDMREFLKHFIDTEKGEIINPKGRHVGWHEGAVLYTLGQRHGFLIDEKTAERSPYYVVEKDPISNVLTVSHDPKDPEFTKDMAELTSINWVEGLPPKQGKIYQARFRHQGALHACTLADAGTSVCFREPQHGLAHGQSVVLYDGEVCLGGGIVS